MRQILSRALAVAATTSALSLCGTWAFAAHDPQGTEADAPTAPSSRAFQWDVPDEPFDVKQFDAMHSKVEDTMSRFDKMWGQDSQDTSGHHTGEPSTNGRGDASGTRETSAYGPEEPSGYGPSEPSGYGPSEPSGYGPDEPTGYGSEEPAGYGPDEPSGYGPDEPAGYGPEEPAGYGPHEPAGYGPEEPPKPTPPSHTTPPASPTPTPTRHAPEKPAPHGELPDTGIDEGVLAAMAGGGALLAAGTFLYRRGRAASRR
ncbi:LPXTG cell wall anchor domain-containing protein [Streptomyces sp. NPDC057301]|uniref:LPXTG cell wall anchor domain-containing protein n=1 Tax=Streptomyces sp. NPDC057301 TaxID=3346093 RepID=UPI0036426A90